MIVSSSSKWLCLVVFLMACLHQLCFSGPLGEIPEKKCLVDHCKNNSTCFYNQEKKEFECKCNHLFTGPKCEEKVKVNSNTTLTDIKTIKERDTIIVCDKNHCENNGTCTYDPKNKVRICNCSGIPFEGPLCEIAKCTQDICPEDKGICRVINNRHYCTEACEENSCFNGGKCYTDQRNNMTKVCDCSKTEFQGPRCDHAFCPEDFDVCSEVGGKCKIVSNSRKCTKECEIDDVNFCMNEGLCYLDMKRNGTKSCDCTNTGFTGDKCELAVCTEGYCNAIGGECRVLNNTRYCTRPCASNTCQNGGICLQDLNTDNSTLCDCTGLSYEGPTCNLVKCTPDFCANYGGDCKVINNQRYCTEPCDNGQKNYCENGGTCFKDLRDNNSTNCDCNGTSFEGDTCNKAKCTPDYCDNGGQCKVVNNTRYCDCSSVMFTGSSCQFPKCTSGFCPSYETCSVDYYRRELYCDRSGESAKRHKNCIEFPCQNNGTCHIRYNGQPECDCSHTGFEGLFCETSVCENVNCNNGHCKPSIGSDKRTYCLCDPGYRGRFCEEKYCPENFCFNGGRCSVNHNSELFCKCLPEYEGDRCEQRKVCGPCEEGHCRFNEELGDYTCVCKDSHTGPTCNQPKNCPKDYCNGGRCKIGPEPDKYFCDCSLTKMAGPRCEIPMKIFR